MKNTLFIGICIALVVIGGIPYHLPLLSGANPQTNRIAVVQANDIVLNGTDYNATIGQLSPNLDLTIDPRIIIEYAGYASYIVFPLQPYPGLGFPHDLAVQGLSSSKTVVGQKYNCSVNVTVVNDGEFPEAFNFAVYANATMIRTQAVSSLLNGMSEALAFNWSTSSFAYGNYTIKAYASPVPSEVYTRNNNLIMWGFLTVTIPGDINGDGKVNLQDLVLLANAYKSKPGDANWNPNADIDGNNIVGLTDLTNLAINYNRQI
jgi:hypothetical protein